MRLRSNRKSQKGRKRNEPPTARRAGSRAGTGGSSPVVIDSVTLMGGRRELIIRHGADTYRLRVTASNKLILTK
jgi:hemin uptake protein HemP